MTDLNSQQPNTFAKLRFSLPFMLMICMFSTVVCPLRIRCTCVTTSMLVKNRKRATLELRMSAINNIKVNEDGRNVNKRADYDGQQKRKPTMR